MKNTNRLFFAAVISSVVGVGTVAVAHPGGFGFGDGPHRGEMKQEMLEKFDANKDGKLDDTEREAAFTEMKAKREAKRAELTAQFDTNKDGKLDDTERQAMHASKAKERFAQIDTNKDGSISFEEFQAAGPKRHGRGGPRGR